MVSTHQVNLRGVRAKTEAVKLAQRRPVIDFSGLERLVNLHSKMFRRGLTGHIRNTNDSGELS